MQRQRGELVPIGEVVADLDGPVKAIREASPQALHHFTQADQVNQLVAASEADPERGFMARMMALCSLPRTKALVHAPTHGVASTSNSSEVTGMTSSSWPALSSRGQ